MLQHIRTLQFALFALAATAIGQTKMPEIKVDNAQLQRNEHNSFAPVVEKVLASVVTISVSELRVAGAGSPREKQLLEELRRRFGLPDNDAEKKNGPKRRQRIGLGSGVIVSADGYILTNNHVVEFGDEIIVTLDDGKTEFKAKKVGTDPGSDIAVIKIEAAGLKPATFADSDKVKIGDIVLAIGSPFELRHSVAMGIISATGRAGTAITPFGNFLQTDAAINPGNSGGALVDAEGRLVGIPSAIFSLNGGNMGIGFAVPANQARSVMESLVTTGKVSRGFLGILPQMLDEKYARTYGIGAKQGIIVAEVVPGGSAKSGGIKNGDVITSINGRTFADEREFISFVGGLAPGTKVDIKLLRPNLEKENPPAAEEVSLTLNLAERPQESIAAAPAPEPEKVPDVLDGVMVVDINGDMRKRLGIPEDQQGALVTQVDPASPSAEAQVRPGDVIVEIDGKPVKNADDAIKLSEDVKRKSTVRLRISSRGTTRFVIVEENK
jgi:serine protease Do